MLRVKNNNIYFARGETSTLKFEFWTKEGTPYILPPNLMKGGNLASYADVFADGKYADVVYENTNAKPAYELLKNNAIDFRNGISVYNIAQVVFHFYFETMYAVNINVHGLSTAYSNQHSGVTDIHIAVGSLSGLAKLLTAIDINLVIQGTAGFKAYLLGIDLKYIDSGALELMAYKAGTTGKDLQKATEFPVCAMTVRSGSYDSIVLEKYLNLKAPPMYSGDSDYAVGGYNKFTTDEIYETGTTSVADNIVSLDIRKGVYRVYHSIDANGKSIYQHAIMLPTGYKVVPYVFNVVVILNFEDTELLEAKEYTYDVINYMGVTKGPQVFDSTFTGFPLSNVSWKKELIPPHKLVIEDTNNA